MPPLLGLILLLAACLAVTFLGVILLTARMLTRPPRRTYATALASGRAGDPSELPATSHPNGRWSWKAWTFASRGLELPVWEIEGLDSSGPTIVLTHGWGDSRVGGLSRVPWLAQWSRRLILWDMPGHGEAPGTCSLGTLEPTDLLALLDRLGGGSENPGKEQDGPEDLVLYGWSLGAGVSIAAAAAKDTPRHDRIIGVVAEAPYRRAITPARNVIRLANLPHRLTLDLALQLTRRLLGATRLTSSDFDRATLAKKLDMPLLVLHGENDEVCPVQDGRDIAAAAKRGGIVMVPGGGHHGLWTSETSNEAVRPVCEAFFRGLANRAAHARDA